MKKILFTLLFLLTVAPQFSHAQTTGQFIPFFRWTNATGTQATTTNFFSTSGTFTNLFGTNITGFGLGSCTGTSALTFSGTTFGCAAQPQGTITSLTGDVTGSGTGAVATTLATVNSNVGSFTNANITVNGKGLVTAASNGSAGGVTSVSNADGTLTISPTTGLVVASRPAITGDITIAGGSNASVLATVNGNVGSFGGTNSIPNFTVNGKGLITAAGVNTPSIPASEITSGTFGTGSYTFPANLTITGNATTTAFAITSLGVPAGTFLAVNPQGSVIATTTPAGSSGVTSVATTNGITGGTITTTGTIQLDQTFGQVNTAASTTYVGGVTIGKATTTQATSTNQFATTGTFTNLTGTSFTGFGLSSCSGTSALTFSGTTFGCATQPQGTVTAVTGTSNRITSTGGATPVIDISGSYVGQSSITTLGTITTGVWNGTAIANANLANSTISGVALGGTLSNHSHDSTLSGTSYNGSAAVSDWGLNLGTGNIWTTASTTFVNGVTFGTSTTTSATSTNFFATTASSSNLFAAKISGAGLSNCNSASNALTYTLASGTFGCNSISGGTGGTGNVATSTSEIAGQVAYWTSTAGTPATLGKVATSSLVQSTGITIANGTTAFVLGAQPTFTIDQSFSPTWTGAHIFNNIIRSTTTDATTTTLFVSGNASTTNFFGSGLSTCNTSGSSALTYTGSTGRFGCNAISSGGSGSGTVGTSTALVSGQVDFSTGVSTIGNDGGFLWDNTLKQLTATNSIFTKSTTTNATTTSFNISGSSNTGVGTSTPNALFQLFSAATSTLSIDTNSTTKGACIEVKDYIGGGYTYLYTKSGVLFSSTVSCK